MNFEKKYLKYKHKYINLKRKVNHILTLLKKFLLNLIFMMKIYLLKKLQKD